MKVSTNVVKCLVAAGALAVAGGAAAQSKGQWAVAIGANQIQPKVQSGAISAPALPNSLADVGKSTQPIVAISYGLTDNITVELPVSTPYKHKLYAAGAIQGVGQVGTVEALPATVFLQYHFFEPSAMIRPYFGLGASYAYFRKETGSFKLTSLTNPGGSGPTTFSIDNKMTVSAQIGFAVNLNDKWSLNAAFVKTPLRTDVHYSTGQTQHMKLDPNATMVAVAYRF